MEETNTVIYRFKFTSEVTNELYEFAKIHQYDDRFDFKEAWKEWLEENDELVEEETRRLEMLGYDGDIIDKMFRSARYYFRNKNTAKTIPKERRQYINVPKELLCTMDEHIRTNKFDKNYQPKMAFIDFCKNNAEIVEQSINQIIEQGINNADDIKTKLKKTYKNRYFRIMG